MIDRTERYRLKSDVRFRAVADEGIVLLQEAGEVLVVNGVGVRVVELIDRGATLSELIGTIEAEYEVEEEQLRADILSYLGELDEAGVLQTGDELSCDTRS